MADIVQVFNLALSNISAKAFVNSPTENSNERKFCSANIDNAIDVVLSDHDWGFASSSEALALLKESTDAIPPRTPWIYEYMYPSTALVAREILRGSDNEKEVPFELALNNDGVKVLLCDKQSASLRFTKRLSNPALFSPKAIEVLGWKLATMIAISLTKNLKLKQNAEQEYSRSLARAQILDFNEGVNRVAPTPTSIQART
jgi:hypothetical protein